MRQRPPQHTLHLADWLDAAPLLARESIDFLYADPPFNTGAAKRTPPNAYKRALSQREGTVTGTDTGTGTGTGADKNGLIFVRSPSGLPEGVAESARTGEAHPPSSSSPVPSAQSPVPSSSSYSDSFPSTAAYIAWLRARLLATLPALKPSAVIAIHCDYRASHHIRLLLDDLLSPDNFINHLIWHYGLGGSSPRRFARKHDDILVYGLDQARYYFEPPMIPATSNRMKGQLKKATDVIRLRSPSGLPEGVAESARPGEDSANSLDSLLDIPSLNNMSRERTGYPTQKPLALLDLLVQAFCPPKGTVLDPCCGSGTTLVAATKAGRSAIGFDASQDAIRLTTDRLGSLA